MTAVQTLEKPAKRVTSYKGSWGGVGFALTEDMSPKEMMEACGADFEVTKEKEYIKLGKRERATGKFSLYRADTDTILSSVSEDWKTNQNINAFEFFDDFCRDGDMTMETAGVLDEGRKVWVLAKVKESFKIGRNDEIDSYLLFSNPHQYGMSTTVMSTPIRVVCENTLQMALAGKTDMMLRLNHRREFNNEEVKKTLNLNKQRLDTYQEAAEFLASKRYDEDQLMEYFGEVFPLTSNKKGEDWSRNALLLWEVIETQPGANLSEGTWWQAFNAVTYATDHLLGRSADTRINSAFFGSGRKRKIDALKRATQFAKAA